MKILIVDNNKQIRLYLQELFKTEGFTVLEASSGEECLEIYASEKPDFICLDIIMDGLSGYDVCREIRKTDSEIPIVFISTKADVIDKVTGLELGGDDYIIKPFDNHEVIARVRAIARRHYQRNEPEKISESFMIGDLTVFPKKLIAMREEESIELSLRDVSVLHLLHQRKGEVVDRDTLLDHCWGEHIMPESRTLDWHISQLRKKVEIDPKNPEIIKTAHGIGYRYDE